MEPSRIHGQPTPLERVQYVREEAKGQSGEQDGPKFELDEECEQPVEAHEERERGEVAPRGENESGGRLDLTA